MGTASGTAPGEGASARQVAGLASVPLLFTSAQADSGARSAPVAYKLWGVGGAPGWWMQGLGTRALLARLELPRGVGRGRQGRLGILQRKHQAGSRDSGAERPEAELPGELGAANSTFGPKLLECCWGLSLRLI